MLPHCFAKASLLEDALRSDKRLNIPRLEDENILIFRKSKKSAEGKEKLRSWEKQLLEHFQDKVVDSEQISKQQRKIILTIPFTTWNSLLKSNQKPGSCYLSSLSEPFNEETEIDYEKLIDWLRHYGLPQYHVHVSGHIKPLQLKDILEVTKAKTIFPAHTENAELFDKFMQDSKSKVSLAEVGKEYQL